MPIPKDKQQKIMGIVIGTVLVLVGAYQFWISVNLQEWSKGRADAARFDALLLKADQVIAEAKRRNPELVTMRTAMSRLESGLPQSNPYAWFVRKVDDLTRQHNIKLVAVEPVGPVLRTKKEDTPGFTVSAFTVKMYIDYDNFGEMIRDIENGFPTAELVNVEIGAGATSPLLQGAKFSFETLVKQ